MKIGLILSNDWELFGDGSGDFFELQQQRLIDLMQVAEPFGAKLTVFAEMGQQWAHQQIANESGWARAIVHGWNESLRQAVSRGHDVQVHLHPQWLDAQHDDGQWQLDLERVAVSGLSSDEFCRLLTRARTELETLLCPLRPSYRAQLFRAGLFCIEPSAGPIAALRAAGFQGDSSVTRGLYDPRRYDFRQTPHAYVPWKVAADSILHEDPEGDLLELPIAAVPCWDSPILRKYARWMYTRRLDPADQAWQARREQWLADRYPESRRAGVFRTAPGWRQRLTRYTSAFLRRTSIPLDYDVLPAQVFVDLLAQVAQSQEVQGTATQELIPVMALGHSKTAPDAGNLERILQLIKSRLGDRVCYLTGQEAVELNFARTTPHVARPAA